MSASLIVALLFGVVVTLYGVIATLVWRRTHGTRVVKCPQTRRLAAVDLNARHAMATAVWDAADLRVKNCSRWPDHRRCDQGCVPAAIAALPLQIHPPDRPGRSL